MSQLAELDRSMRRVELTDEDGDILCRRWDDFQNYVRGIADRNDYAVMLARTTLAKVGCRATRDRVMPA